MISSEKWVALEKRMHALGIYAKDIEEQFIRSCGKGGQKVNKTASCVHLKHIPTGITVKCQDDRSQGMNRFLARRRLVAAIENRVFGDASPDAERIKRLRKQKAKKKKRAHDKYKTTRSSVKEGSHE